MNKLIGLCGYAQTGKDTLGKMLIEKEGYKRYAFADALKKEVRSMLRELVIRADFNNPEDKAKWRDFLVFWGAKRRQMDRNYWIDVLDILIDFNKPSVITDVRYLNEVEWIKEKGGEVYRIKREGYGPDNAEEEMSFSTIEANTNLPIIQNVEEHPEMMMYQLKRSEK